MNENNTLSEYVADYIQKHGYTSLIMNHKKPDVLKAAITYLKTEDKPDSYKEYYTNLLNFWINEYTQ